MLVPFVACSAFVGPAPARQALTRLGGALILCVAGWWVFWLPASMVDISFDQRYRIDEPMVTAPPAAMQSLVVACATWLLILRHDWTAKESRMQLALFALLASGAAWAAEALALACDTGWLPWVSAAVGGCLLIAGRQLSQTGPSRPLVAACCRFLAMQAWLVSLWPLLHDHAKQLPPALQQLGVRMISA